MSESWSSPLRAGTNDTTTSKPAPAAKLLSVARLGDLSPVSYREMAVAEIPDSPASRAWVSPARLRRSRTRFIEPTTTALRQQIQETRCRRRSFLFPGSGVERLVPYSGDWHDRSMRLNISLPDIDVEFLNEYVRSHGFKSRSAALHEAGSCQPGDFSRGEMVPEGPVVARAARIAGNQDIDVRLRCLSFDGREAFDAPTKAIAVEAFVAEPQQSVDEVRSLHDLWRYPEVGVEGLAGQFELPAKSVEGDHVATDHARVFARRRCGQVGERDESEFLGYRSSHERESAQWERSHDATLSPASRRSDPLWSLRSQITCVGSTTRRPATISGSKPKTDASCG